MGSPHSESAIGPSLLISVLMALVALSACGEEAKQAEYPEGSIAAVLAADGRFDTLMQLTEHEMPPVALDSFTALDLDITIFAPTDEAFAALAPGTLEWLRNDDNVSDLQWIFDHHVIAKGYSLAELRSEATSGDGRVDTLTDGSPIELTIDGDALKVDGATVIDGDIQGRNGVIHVIDTVLIPDSVTTPQGS